MSYIRNNGLPQIIAPFWCEKRNNQHWLLFEEIQSPQKISGLQQGLAHGLYISATVLYQLSYEDPNIWSRPICCVHLNPWKEWNIEIKEWRWCELRKYTFVVWCVAHDINFSRGCHLYYNITLWGLQTSLCKCPGVPWINPPRITLISALHYYYYQYHYYYYHYHDNIIIIVMIFFNKSLLLLSSSSLSSSASSLLSSSLSLLLLLLSLTLTKNWY